MADKIITLQNLTSFKERLDKEIDKDLEKKQDVIQDLETIRSGASAGATAVQPEALNDYYTKAEVDSNLENITDELMAETQAREEADTAIRAEKQDVISDLDTIRAGAAAGATAVQPGDLAAVATSGDYRDLINKPQNVSEFTNDAGYITKDVNNLTNYTTTTVMNSLLDTKQNVINVDNQLDADLVNDSDSVHKFATISQLTLIATNAEDIANIKALIPNTTTVDNKLTDVNYVNTAIATNTADFLGTFNIVTDLGLTVDATQAEIIEALTNKSLEPTNNDYVFVSFPDAEEPDQFNKFDRYKYNGSTWEYEYTLNNSSFTAKQWAAINSGITEGLVAQITASAQDISAIKNGVVINSFGEVETALNNKQDKLIFDQTPTQGSVNPVTSGGIYNALETKVDKTIVGPNGRGIIFNESDGGGAKFEHSDGLESFVGVNDGGLNGLAAQIYADRLVNGKWTGAKLDVKNDGIYYTVGDQPLAERAVPANEIAVKGDIAAVTTYKTYNPSWPTTGTTLAFMQAVDADPEVVIGNVYLGDVQFTDLPFSGNGELTVSIIGGTVSDKVILATLTSGNTAPYHWEYTYWGGNASGWKSFVPTDNIKTINQESLIGSGNIAALSSLTILGETYTPDQQGHITVPTKEVDTLDIDAYPTENSINLVRSGGVYARIATKQDAPLSIGTAGQVLTLNDNLHPVWTTVNSGIKQILTQNYVKQLSNTEWSSLKVNHYLRISDAEFSGLDSNADFVMVKFAINNIDETVMMIKNATTKYSGLFQVEENSAIYELSLYYNASTDLLVLRCAQVL